MTQPTRHIQAYSLLEYTQKLNEALNEGYELKLDTNEGTCQHIGFYFEVLMYKKTNDKLSVNVNLTLEPELKDYIDSAITEVKQLQADAGIKVQPQKQRGRPSTK